MKEIRKLVRRRYANRKNFQKIFREWDTDNTGNISVDNIREMINRMGININFDEANVLMASVDQNYSGNLTLDEFM